MNKKKLLYPGTDEAEKQRGKKEPRIEEPDFIGNAPNYEKFGGWSAAKVLAFLNID